MSNTPDTSAAEGSAPTPRTPLFATTCWTLVLGAGNADNDAQVDALATLCQTYWYPLYAFARRQGSTPHDAQDLTQSFFAELLERNYLHRADRNKGRFRAFLLGAFRHFLSHERARQRTLKRGGRTVHVTLDEQLAEELYSAHPGTTASPEILFDRSWAWTLVERVKQRVADHYRDAGKADRFHQLQSFLPGFQPCDRPSAAAAALGLSEGALRVELHRLRTVFRQFLRAEIAHTVATPTEIDEELRHLIAILADPHLER